MKNTKVIVFASVAGALLFGSFLLVNNDSSSAYYRTQVADIVSKGQNYDGELEDNLTALGPDAVPAISETVLAVEKFHTPYVNALARIGSVSAVEPLLELLELQEPMVSSYKEGVTVNIIDALKQLPDRRTTSTLIPIMDSDSSHPRVRLAAAGAVAQIDEAGDRDAARDLIMGMYADRSSYYGMQGAGFDESDLHKALMDANTDESLEILIESLKSAPPSYISMPIVGYVSTKANQEIADILLQVVDDKQSHELHVRILAAESLTKVPVGVSGDQLKLRFDDLIAETKNDGWPSQLVERAEALRVPQN